MEANNGEAMEYDSDSAWHKHDDLHSQLVWIVEYLRDQSLDHENSVRGACM